MKFTRIATIVLFAFTADTEAAEKSLRGRFSDDTAPTGRTSPRQRFRQPAGPNEVSKGAGARHREDATRGLSRLGEYIFEFKCALVDESVPPQPVPPQPVPPQPVPPQPVPPQPVPPQPLPPIGKCPVKGELIVLADEQSKCIARSGRGIGLVDCNAAAESQLWDFAENGFWCLTNDGNNCVGPDLSIGPLSGGNQQNSWTHSDPANKISQFSAFACLNRMEGNKLGLTNCRAASTSNWNFVVPCGYPSNANVRRRDLHESRVPMNTNGGRNANRYVCARFYSGQMPLGDYQCEYISNDVCGEGAFERFNNPRWVVPSNEGITSVELSIQGNGDIFIERTLGPFLSGPQGAILEYFGEGMDNRIDDHWDCLSSGFTGGRPCSTRATFDLLNIRNL